MCIIIDTNSFSHVFNTQDCNHSKFRPVYDWITSSCGSMVYGGTRYNNELRKNKYLKLIATLKSKTKFNVIKVDDSKVDAQEARIIKIIPDKKFDDPHLPAIAIVAKCHLICSLDMASVKFVTNPALYPKHFLIPKYYSQPSNKNLLCNKYIDKSYKQHHNKKQTI